LYSMVYFMFLVLPFGKKGEPVQSGPICRETTASCVFSKPLGDMMAPFIMKTLARSGRGIRKSNFFKSGFRRLMSSTCVREPAMNFRLLSLSRLKGWRIDRATKSIQSLSAS